MPKPKPAPKSAKPKLIHVKLTVDGKVLYDKYIPAKENNEQAR